MHKKIHITVLLSAKHQDFDKVPFLKSAKKSKKSPGKDIYQQLEAIFSAPLPIAELGALGENFYTSDSDWLRIDPVQLYADLAQVFLIGNTHLNLQSDEIEELKNTINDFLKSESLEIFVANALEWYLKIPFNLEIKTHSLYSAQGKNIYNYLPEGKQKAFWQKLLTELQMLLEVNSVNKKRKIAYLPLVNSVWFWGEGKLTELKLSNPFTAIVTNQSVVKGITKLSDTNLISFTQPVENFSSGKYLFVINLETDNKTLINKQFEIFHDLIKKNQIDSVEVECLDGITYIRKAKSWWQKILG